MGSLLSLRGYGIGLGERVILSSVDLDMAETGVLSLLGPMGTGKSLLLRTLAGLNEANPNLRTWGDALYVGAPLGQGDRPAMLMQSAKLMTASILRNVLYEIPEKHTLDLVQQRELAVRLLEAGDLGELTERIYEPVTNLDLALNRHLSILRLCAASPRMICLDEPTTGLGEREAERLLRFIARQSEQRAVLISLHQRDHARALGGDVALLAGGIVQESGSIERFLTAPTSEAGRSYVFLGSCSGIPSPGAPPETLAEDAPKPAPIPPGALVFARDSFGPRGFLWLKKGVLAGTPMPGVFYDPEYDVKALARVGVARLICLTALPPTEPAVDSELLARYGIVSYPFPIPDMGAPSLDQAREICEKIDALIAEGRPTAVHCRAGMGRTGTVLAAYRIWEGDDAITALETVRRIEPRWVQSQTQVAFLEAFDDHLRSAPLRRAA